MPMTTHATTSYENASLMRQTRRFVVIASHQDQNERGKTVVHELKCSMLYFAQVTAPMAHRKTFELRLDDRPYARGDILHLYETHPVGGEQTGRNTGVQVTSILRDYPGIEPGYCIMSIHQLGAEEMPYRTTQYVEPQR